MDWDLGKGVLTPADPPLAMDGFLAGVPYLSCNSLEPELTPLLDGTAWVRGPKALAYYPSSGECGRIVTLLRLNVKKYLA